MLARNFRKSLALGTALTLGMAASPAFAQLITAGDLNSAVDSAGNPGQLTVTNPNASTANVAVLAPVVVANWNQFNVPANTTANFTNASAAPTASVLNRVIGGGFSDIGGTINATGVNLWLINQNGIIFGQNAVVNANSFFASTLDVADQDYFDLYEGTNAFGNGTATVNFATNPTATTFIAASENAGSRPSFTTTQGLMFIGPALNLVGDFYSGTGTAAFVAATGMNVIFGSGSPISYTIANGTTVANQSVGGSIVGNRADFITLTAASVTNALLTVNASVATTAVAGTNGINLVALSDGMGTPSSITTNGTIQTSGDLSVSGRNITFNNSVTGGSVSVSATGTLSSTSLQGITATTTNIGIQTNGGATTTALTANNGSISITENAGGNIQVGALTAGTSIALNTSGTITGTTANAGGAFNIGNIIDPSTVTFSGNITAGSVDIDSTAATSLQGVTANAGLIDLDVASLTAGALSATGAIAIDGTGAISLASATANSDGNGTEGVVIGATTLPSSLTITGATSGGSVDLQATGNLQLGNVTSTAGVVDLDSTGGAITAGAVSAAGGNASITAPGAVTTTSVASSAAVDVDSTAGGALSLGNVTGGTTVALDTSGSLQAGTVSVGGSLQIGSTTRPSSLLFTGNASANEMEVRANGNITTQNLSGAGSKIIAATGGSVQTGTITTTGNAGFNRISASGATGDVTTGDIINGGSGLIVSAQRNIVVGNVTNSGPGGFIGASVGFESGGSTTVGNVSTGEDLVVRAGTTFAGGNLSAGDDVDIRATGNITTGTVSALGTGPDARNFTLPGTPGNSLGVVLGAETLTGSNISLITGVGTVTTGALAANNNVKVSAPGSVTTSGITATGGTIDVDSTADGNLDVGALASGSAITLDTAGTVAFGNVTATGTQMTIGGTVAPSAITTSGVLKVGTFSAFTGGGLSLGGANEIANLGKITAGGTILVNSITDLALVGAIASPGQAITITTSGNLTIGAQGTVSGSVIGLSATGNFINNRGADALTASDRWAVYSAAPGSNTFGGLDSGNTAIWNATIGSLAPGAVTGNRYVFAFRPTITITTTNASKVYGTDLSSLLGGNYTATGFQPGVAGAFLADSAANILSGAPQIASTGSVANADVAAGPYTITASAGSLTADRGYALAFDNAGRLTVTPKPITGTVTANNKTYDGTAAATGSVALAGVLAGDDVSTAGTRFTFADKNAGVGKVVTVGFALTGADAGNYTVTVPSSTLADILAKAITATVTANGKVYDGTTATTGTVTLNGVVAGDTVGTAGTTFTFTDKNAGTGKTVTVAGTTLTGPDAGNYTVTVPSSTLADILAKAITASVAANNKTYDGTTAGTGSVTLNGVVAGDTVGTTGTTFTFADKNAGTGKTVTVAGTTLTGPDAGNYTVTVPSSTLADILRRIIAIAADNQNKIEGATDPDLTFTVTGGSLVASDSFSGSLSRETGEAPGLYEILIGNLTAGQNYVIEFTPSRLTILADDTAPVSDAVPIVLRSVPLPGDTSSGSGTGSSSVTVDEGALCEKDRGECVAR